MRKARHLFASIGMALFVALCVSGLAYAATIVYVTARNVPTVNEKAEIAALKAQAGAQYTLRVISAEKAAGHVVAGEYIAGTIPPNYRDGGIDSGTPLKTVYNPALPPQSPSLPSGQATVKSGDLIYSAGGGHVTLTVSGHTARISAYLAPDAGS